MMRVVIMNILAISASIADIDCPKDERSHEKRKGEFNCTNNMAYHCGFVANGSLTELCLKEKAFFEEECPIFLDTQGGDFGGVDTYACPTNCSGCPNTTYVSSELYKYPTCYIAKVQAVNDSIRKIVKMSVICPKEGPSQSSSALTSTMDTSEEAYTVQSTNFTSNFMFETENQDSNSHLFAAITVISMVVWLILISFCCYKTRSANKTVAKVPLELSTRSSLHHRDSHNPNFSSTICHSQTLSQNNLYRPCHPESVYDEINHQQDTTHQHTKFASATPRQKSFVVSKRESTQENYYASSSHNENLQQDNSFFIDKFEKMHQNISPHTSKSETVYDEVDNCDTVIASDTSLVLCDEDNAYYRLEPRMNLPV